MSHTDFVHDLIDDVAESPSYDQNQPRQRLRSWLTDQLDSGNCPGCNWINKNVRIFKLTWKHYGRPGFDEDRDAKIFREWARHTKRYSPGDPADVSTWKTRFRNALHKMPDIEEMAGHHQLDGNDPYRVYRFRTPEEMDRIRKAQTTSFAMMNSPINVLSPAPSYIIPEPSSPYCPPETTPEIHQIMEYLKQQNEVSNIEQQRNANISTFNDEDFEDIEKILMKETMASTNQLNVHAMIKQEPQSTNVHAPHNVPMTAIGLKLFFSDKEAGSHIVNTPHGVRIAYQPPHVPSDIAQEDGAKEVLSNIFGPLEAQQVYYPHAEDENSQKMLNWIRRGLVLEVKPHGDIYATRLCQAKVFYSDNVLKVPKVLDRSQQTLIYSFQDEFLPSLQAYRHGQGVAPSCERYFSFGQKWSFHEPLKEVLVHCSVTHFFSKKLFKDAKAQRPIEQFISSQNPDDVLKEKMEKIALSDTFA